jgi:hypothetical protein
MHTAKVNKVAGKHVFPQACVRNVSYNCMPGQVVACVLFFASNSAETKRK